MDVNAGERRQGHPRPDVLPVRSLDKRAQGGLALSAAKMAILFDAIGSNIVPHDLRLFRTKEVHSE
jgi:hypothetical protein